MNGLHRDDFDFEEFQGIEAALQAEHPDTKVVCVGDIPGELSDELKDAIQKIDDLLEQELLEGKCHDCGNIIPGEWPPTVEEGQEQIDLPEGWSFHAAVGPKSDAPLGILICPNCDKEQVRMETHDAS